METPPEARPANTAGTRPTVTTEQVNARAFVYCSVTFTEPLGWAKVLLPFMPARDAKPLAKAIAEEHVGRTANGEVHAYPRTYVREARELVALGGVGYREQLDGRLA